MQNDTIALLIMKIQLFCSVESYALNVQISNTYTATLESTRNGVVFRLKWEKKTWLSCHLIEDCLEPYLYKDII